MFSIRAVVLVGFFLVSASAQAVTWPSEISAMCYSDTNQEITFTIGGFTQAPTAAQIEFDDNEDELDLVRIDAVAGRTGYYSFVFHHRAGNRGRVDVMFMNGHFGADQGLAYQLEFRSNLDCGSSGATVSTRVL